MNWCLNLCRELGATVYLSGPLGRNYLREELFSHEQIAVRYDDYQHPVYPQVYPGFEPYMAAIDLLFNCGPGKSGTHDEKSGTNHAMNVLVVAAHPDDELLGCGGTAARLAREGHSVYMAILGEGITSRHHRRESADPSALKEPARLQPASSGSSGSEGAFSAQLAR